MPKDDTTWLNISYVALAVLTAYVVWNALHTLGLQTGWDERFIDWYGMTSTAASVIVGAGTSFFLRRDTEKHEYFLAAIAELRKVTWPTVDDTKKMTMIVVIVVGVFSAILAVFDVVWAKVLNLLLVTT
jgi:preprotein translocase SecE subunit